MNKLYIYSNSTGYIPMVDRGTPGGESYIDLFLEKYKWIMDGLWMNGFTIYHMLEQLKFISGRTRNSVVILNFGICEALTQSIHGFLYQTTRFLNTYGPVPEFMSYVLPKMEEASWYLSHFNYDKYYRWAEPKEFESMVKKILKGLEGFPVFVIGLSAFSDSLIQEKPHWHQQAEEFNSILKSTASLFNKEYVDIGLIAGEHSVDTAHMTSDGHRLIFNYLVNQIENGGL